MLFPSLGDDFPSATAIKPDAAATDTFSNSPGSERGVGTPGSKHSPDSGYISSRGVGGMVDSPGFLGGGGEKLPNPSQGADSFLGSDRLADMSAPNSRTNLVTSSAMGMTGGGRGQMTSPLGQMASPLGQMASPLGQMTSPG